MDFHSYFEKLTQPRTILRLSTLEDMLRAFTPGERLALYALTIVLGASAIGLLIGLNSAVSVRMPTYGGAFTEGRVGSARFINPILAISQSDEDLSELIYSGLTRIHPDGRLIMDIAQSYEISPDGTMYTFKIKPDAAFHDKSPVTAADVMFTVDAAKNAALRSPRRADWEGVEVSSPDPLTVVFKLPRPYTPFIENTSLGILPKHIWANVSPEDFPFNPANTRPIGSGPYRIVRTEFDATGAATRYDLAPFSRFALGKPFLKRMTFIFYPNQTALIEALNEGEIDAVAGVAPHDLGMVTRTDMMVARVALPRVFGVFFNQNHAPVLADQAVREALLASVDKQEIIRSVLGGYGVALDGAVPPGATGTHAPAVPEPFVNNVSTSTEAELRAALVDSARSILIRGGWTFDEAAGVWKKKKLELSFSLATADEPELVATVNAVAKYWRAAGIKVAVQIYPLSELNTNVIRPRSYDAILFGEVVGRTADLFAFWHSSQRNDPGLNLALYANSKVDGLLAQARATTERKAREALYVQFDNEIAKDNPGVFLYAPEFIYLVPQSVHGIKLGALSTPSERYQNAYEWYADTENVWSIFTSSNN